MLIEKEGESIFLFFPDHYILEEFQIDDNFQGMTSLKVHQLTGIA